MTIIRTANQGPVCDIQTPIRTLYNRPQMKSNPINDVPPPQTPGEAQDSIDIADISSQPEAQNGVSEDMSTLAFHPGLSSFPGNTGNTPGIAPGSLNPGGQISGGRNLAHPQPEVVELTPAQAAARAEAVARGDFSVLTDA